MGNYKYEPIKKLKENNKKKMFFVFLTIFMFLGISFATLYFVYRYNDTRKNTIVSGLVDIDFQEKGASINLEKTVPMTDEAGKKNSPYIFTVLNISKIPINLKIGIKIGTNTIDLSAIRYALYINNEEVKVDNLANLDSENNLYIKEKFASGAKIEAKLVFWIDYYYEKPGGSFSGTIIVEGEQYDVIYEETGADTIKKKLVPYSKSSQKNFTGGLVAINTEGKLYNETDASQKVREYRYSGPEVNNYIYFNCEADATEEDASSKCELWRIVGIFKDDNRVEHLKIVRDNVLTGDILPETYTISGITYKIKYESEGDHACWNSLNPPTDFEENNWATAGLQYWLNTTQDETVETPNPGYLSYLKGDTLNMIEKNKYYLGTITYGSVDSGRGIIDTPKEAYVNERDVESCIDNVGKDRTESGCKVWKDNKATWEGKVALLYPSDYGFSAGSNYWETKLGGNSFNGDASNTSWLQRTANHSNYEWLLSPSSNDSNYVTDWRASGSIVVTHANDYNYGSHDVRPSLNLISKAKIIWGDGSKTKPYFLSGNPDNTL